MSAPHRVYQFGDVEFAPLRTLFRSNLPIQATPLVGRENELEEAGELIHRLLTLTGAGGSGKTRLALQLAAEAIS